MKKINQLEKRKEYLDREMKRLEIEKQNVMVADGKAFLCKKCNHFVELENATSIEKETKPCWNCNSKIRRERQKKETLKKLKGAKVVDINLGSYNEIESIVLYKNGNMMEIDATWDDEEAHLRIDREWKDECQEELEVQRPGNKPRKEKPLQIP